MRYEITAKVPTIAGACPFIYLYGASDMYGDGIEQRGQISIMEWNQRLGKIFNLFCGLISDYGQN